MKDYKLRCIADEAPGGEVIGTWSLKSLSLPKAKAEADLRNWVRDGRTPARLEIIDKSGVTLASRVYEGFKFRRQRKFGGWREHGRSRPA